MGCLREMPSKTFKTKLTTSIKKQHSTFNHPIHAQITIIDCDVSLGSVFTFNHAQPGDRPHIFRLLPFTTDLNKPWGRTFSCAVESVDVKIKPQSSKSVGD